MRKCPKCGNTEYYPGGLCAYCVWKGGAGPGSVLKESIKQENKKKDQKTTNKRP